MTTTSVKVAGSPTAPPDDDDRQAWLSSLAALWPVPEEVRSEVTARTHALDMLRCGEELLDDLCRHGLPHAGPPGHERFDRFDLFNLAVYSGTGRSLPELTLAYVLRWMGAGPESWSKPSTWTFDAHLACGRADGCRGGATWELCLPCPEVFGGHVVRLETNGTVDSDRGWLRSEGDTGLAAEATLVTVGSARQVRSRRLRAVIERELAEPRRWVRLPESVQWQHDRVLAAGLAPCISLSLRLEQICREAGFSARSRRGWILGMLDLPHAWLEVVDEDGVTKAIDPVFAELSKFSSEVHPAFVDTCFGSFFNRLLPTPIRADQPLSRHSCGGERAPVELNVTIRAAPDTAPAGARP